MAKVQHIREQPERLLERYELLEEIGRGGQARTYRARDAQTGSEVAVKELDLRRASDWKALELFEREAKVLRALSHPGIPRYIDAFNIDKSTNTSADIADASGDARFFIVQEYVEGESLQAKIERGDLLAEPEARALLEELFEILIYLHAHAPPVVHRDIKPANIMIRPSGRYALVDFGTVQEIVQGRAGGETVVGSSGFLPPEQLMGRAAPASDLYALGATVVYAMCGVHPVELPMRRIRLEFHDFLDCSHAFKAFLGRMLDPAIERRFSSAETARRRLQHLPAPGALAETSADLGALLREHCADSFEDGAVRLARRGEQMVIDFSSLRGGHTSALVLLAIALLFAPTMVINPAAGALITAMMLLFSATLFGWRRAGFARRTVVFTPTEMRVMGGKRAAILLEAHPLETLGSAHGQIRLFAHQLEVFRGTKSLILADHLKEETCAKLSAAIDEYLNSRCP